MCGHKNDRNTVPTVIVHVKDVPYVVDTFDETYDEVPDLWGIIYRQESLKEALERSNQDMHIRFLP